MVVMMQAVVVVVVAAARRVAILRQILGVVTLVSHTATDGEQMEELSLEFLLEDTRSGRIETQTSENRNRGRLYSPKYVYIYIYIYGKFFEIVNNIQQYFFGHNIKFLLYQLTTYKEQQKTTKLFNHYA